MDERELGRPKISKNLGGTAHASSRYVAGAGVFNRLTPLSRSRIGALGGLAAALLLALSVLSAPPSARAQPQPGETLRLMVMGDSLTSGYGLPVHESFSSQLERALRENGHAVAVINAGVSGDTSAGGRARLGWALSDKKPDAVILELGANDGLRGIDPRATYDNLAAMLTMLKAKSIPAFLAGMYAPPNLGAEYGEEFRAVYTRLAKEFDVPLYDFFLEGVAAQLQYNQPDGMHPNAAGVAVIVQKILPSIEAWLGEIASR